MTARTRKQTATDQPQQAAESQQEQEQAPAPEPQPAPEPEKAPEPTIVIEVVQVPYHRPSVTFADGRVVVCAHKYLHESPKSATACGRKIAASGAFVK